eukprot:gnl/MRDRNA2_/MRDRNA2_218106_c0_seq1.p1 gnl/MRDRNA2_/MRDRNA2_218106_c0~~gnl/MRDRNA2_/MRDRNA2_218106_c0_seq1.p1  ORF type:complete len:295 (+),score=44.31 gnl/MRDRNA2_/MRDRNA2_218106_c0_seq1:98-982(+)
MGKSVSRQNSTENLVDNTLTKLLWRGESFWHSHNIDMDGVALGKTWPGIVSGGKVHVASSSSDVFESHRALHPKRLSLYARSTDLIGPRRSFFAMAVAMMPLWAWHAKAKADRNVRLFDVTNSKTQAAFAAMERGDFALAETLFSRTLLDDPDRCRSDTSQVCSKTFSNMGSAQLSLGKLYEAQFSFNRAIALAPEVPVLRVNRATVLLALEEFEAAAEDCTFAIALDPKNAEAWQYRGQIQARMSRWDAAVEDYRKAVNLAPSFANSRLERAIFEWQNGSTEVASQLFRSLIE